MRQLNRIPDGAEPAREPRSSVSADFPRATRCCKWRTTTTRRFSTATSATSTTSTRYANRPFDGRAVTYGFGELDTLVPAYAGTIHKSQGSEYPAVIIPVLTQHYAMLQRNLIYTGVTRGKGWWSWSARRRPSRSRFATFRGGDAGRSLTMASARARPLDRRIH